MKNELIANYENSLQAIYNHVGFVESWVVCPINVEGLSSSWKIDGDEVIYYDSAGEEYSFEIYTQRFYEKHIYRGEKFTMIFGEPHVDGMKWFYLFDNEKEIK